MSKIESAILNRQRLGHKVWTGCAHAGGVSVMGKMACSVAARMAKQGKVKEFRNSSQYGRIGNNADGSWKYGMTFEGIVILHD